MENDKEIADTLLSYSSNAQYLLSRLEAKDERWSKVTSAVMMQLGRQYGASTVLLALQEIRMREPEVKEPVGYLRTVCSQLAASRAPQETSSPETNGSGT